MTDTTDRDHTSGSDAVRASWIPMAGLFLAQILMSYNVAARRRRARYRTTAVTRARAVDRPA